MSSPAARRLIADMKRLDSEFKSGVFAKPLMNNLYEWHAIILGPSDSHWDGGCFKLILEFSMDYPTKPPTVRFVTPMFHPNIYSDGKICIDILDNAWVPMYDTYAILTSIQQLLLDPNPNSPANSTASKMLMEDQVEYNKQVRVCVENSWKIGNN